MIGCDKADEFCRISADEYPFGGRDCLRSNGPDGQQLGGGDGFRVWFSPAPTQKQRTLSSGHPILTTDGFPWAG
jgi:hypothetical protein